MRYRGGGGLPATARQFDLAPLDLDYGTHEITVVALGVQGQSLNSPPSDSVFFILTPPGAATIAVAFEHFYSMTPIVVATPIRILGSPAERFLDIYVDDPGRYDDSIRWMIGARQLGAADGVSPDGARLTLGPALHGNRIGEHTVTVVVHYRERTWSQLVTFTVER